MNYKMIIFDCDGTITDLKTWKVVPSAVTAINLLREAGYKTVLATGRPTYSMPAIDEAGLKFDYYVCSNGHLIADENKKTLLSQTFDRDLFEEINEYCRQKNLGLFWKFEDGAYSYVYHPDTERIYGGLPCNHLYENPDRQALPNNASLVGDENSRRIFMERFEGRLQCVDGGLLLFDVNLLNVNKKTGIEHLLKLTGISPEQCVAYGDSENDIEMLDYCGLAVVMGDGMELAREHGDYIADATVNDGIIKSLYELNILK